MESLRTLFSQILLASLTALIAVRLSIRQFSTQQWWERKAKGYEEIMSALSQELSRAYAVMDAEERGEGHRNMSPAELEQSKAAQRRINEAAALGAFIISEESAGHLAKLRRELSNVNTTTLYEHVSGEYEAMNKCIEALRESARIDLGIPRPGRFSKLRHLIFGH